MKPARESRRRAGVHDPRHGRSAYSRIPNDAYFTCDERCAARLLEVVPPHAFNRRGRVLEMAAGNGMLMRDLRKGGVARLTGWDLKPYRPVCPGLRISIRDSLRQKKLPRGVGAIVTNPPNGLSVLFIRHALELVRAVRGLVAFLVPFGWDEPPGRINALPCGLALRILLGFRPWWSTTARHASPIAQWMWLVWDWRHKGPPVTVYA